MSPLATQQTLAAPRSRNAGAALRSSGKASISNTLNDGDAVLGTVVSTRSGLPDRRRTSRNGTTRRAPLWNGLALSPAFAAQVLGQVLMPQRHSSSDGSVLAYRRRAARMPAALLVDIKL